MTLEDAIVRYHLDLAGQEADAIREQLAALGVSVAEIERMIDQHAGDGDSLPNGWWLAMVPILGLFGARLRHRLIRIATARLVAVSTMAVEAFGRALDAMDGKTSLGRVSPAGLTMKALAGPEGRSWPEWSGKAADDMFKRLSSDFRTAHTRAEVAELVARARRLAGNALTATTATAMHSAANRARLAAAAGDGRFSRWRYAAVLDDRTSEICRDLNGTEWRFNDPNAPLPPRHPNCRSVVVPLE